MGFLDAYAGLAKDGFAITDENLKASPAVERAHHFNSYEDLQNGLKNAYVKPLKPLPIKPSNGQVIAYNKAVIEHNIAKIKCLQSEYQSREKNIQREYHGTSVFGKYISGGGFFTRKIGFKASEKLVVANEILEALNPDKTGMPTGKLSKEHYTGAAAQGELGRCVKEILDAQKILDWAESPPLISRR